jgi:PST family polysaccharide transporter
MRFTALAIRDLLATVVGVSVAIAMAWKGAGYWPIVAYPLATVSCQMTLSWLMVRWIPSFPQRNADVRSLLRFGSRVVAYNLLWQVNRSADSVLIGWHSGAGPLGLYSRAYNLLMLPIRQLSFPARSVAVPALCRTQDDPERFARYYLRMVNLMFWISTLVFGFLFVVAEPLVVLGLGSNWRGAVPVFQILALTAPCQLLLETVGWLLVSQGNSDRLFKPMLVISPVIIGSFVVGLPFGINGVALAGSLALLGIFPPLLNFVFRGTQLTIKRLAKAIACPIFLSLASILSAKGALYILLPHVFVWQLAVVALAFGVTYSLALLLPRVRYEVLSLKKLLATRNVSESPA